MSGTNGRRSKDAAIAMLHHQQTAFRPLAAVPTKISLQSARMAALTRSCVCHAALRSDGFLPFVLMSGLCHPWVRDEIVLCCKGFGVVRAGLV